MNRNIKALRKIMSVLMCLVLSFSNYAFAISTTSTLSYDVDDYDTTNASYITFSDSSISATGVTGNYSISGTVLTITGEGVFIIDGTCSNGEIFVSKNSGEVTLILNGLDLTATDEGTCPIYAKGGTNVVTIVAADGTVNSLADADHSEVSPKSCINAAQDITICGGGTLNVTGNNKNGIKSDTDVTIEDVTLNVTSVGNSISTDENLIINSGTVTVNASTNGLISSPDILSDDGSNGNITINEGTISVTSVGDAIQADNLLLIYDGTFNIKTNGGYTTTLSDDDSSCKGLKSSNTVTVYGGTFNINTADDAIHSNDCVFLLGGNFTIYTADDGAHADTSLFLGSEDGGCPVINIVSSYEGLEGGTVYIYSAEVSLYASDDGINAAGGSSNGTDGQQTGPSSGDSFNPGGGSSTGPGGRSMTMSVEETYASSTSDYSINIYNGDIYVNADGDGLDSNGDINITGGKVVVFGQASGGDNSALDYETSCLVTGGILLACGSASAPGTLTPSSGSQSYIVKTTSISSGKYINVKDASGSVVMSVYCPKSVNHEVYSPASSSYTITTASTLTTTCSHTSTYTVNQSDATCEEMGYTGDVYCSDCNELISQGSWIDATGHTWDEGTVTTEPSETEYGVMTYTCTVCGETYTEEIEPTEEQKYTVTFVTDNGATVDVYYTQDYTTADEENITETYARDSSTGEIDTSGSGQVNFYVNVPDGYEISSVTADANYKNLKGYSDTGVENMYRLTKITGDVTVTICCTSTEEEDDDEETGYTVTFVTDNGATVDVYYTQDYTTADEEDVTEAYARDSSTGEIDTSGNGQVNFYVNVPDGYEISSVTADANYKNLKDSTETLQENTYRLTKITGDVTVTITCTAVVEEDDDDEEDNTTFLKGDLDRDGDVDAVDAALALDFYKYGGETEDDILRGDMDEDGDIDATDAALILDVYKYGS